MARPLRIDIAGGWYHVTGRGNERRNIFWEDGDRVKFLSYLEEWVERFGVRLHGYVLMDNHYHLLVETPEANLSRAMHWLNVSYSVWVNRKHRRVGHLFQGRYKGIVVEAETWGLRLSRYLHLNPVRVWQLGLGKSEQALRREGLAADDHSGLVKERRKRLNGYRWSSYRAYAGLEKASAWLECREVWRMIGGRSVRGQVRAYRRYVDSGLGGDGEERPWESVKSAVILGEGEFVDRVRRLLKGNEREQGELKRLQKRRELGEVIRVVDGLKGEPWEMYRDRHGDWGRDLVLYLGRKWCGMRLRELGERVGGLDYAGVCMAAKRLGRRAAADPSLSRIVAKAEGDLLNVKMRPR